MEVLVSVRGLNNLLRVSRQVAYQREKICSSMEGWHSGDTDRYSEPVVELIESMRKQLQEVAGYLDYAIKGDGYKSYKTGFSEVSGKMVGLPPMPFNYSLYDGDNRLLVDSSTPVHLHVDYLEEMFRLSRLYDSFYLLVKDALAEAKSITAKIEAMETGVYGYSVIKTLEHTVKHMDGLPFMLGLGGRTLVMSKYTLVQLSVPEEVTSDYNAWDFSGLSADSIKSINFKYTGIQIPLSEKVKVPVEFTAVDIDNVCGYSEYEDSSTYESRQSPLEEAFIDMKQGKFSKFWGFQQVSLKTAVIFFTLFIMILLITYYTQR